MAGNRSVFVAPDYEVDSFPTLYDLPPKLVQDANELQQLKMTVNKTSEQITRMNNLVIELANYMINPETWNHMQDCIVNLETNWMNIYHDFTDYINQAQEDIDTYINNKQIEINTFINQNKIDITNFVDNRKAEMLSARDAYIALVNQKENELSELNTKTDIYWQKWSASSAGQTEYNIFDSTAENPLPESAVLNFDISKVELAINGTIQTPYVDYDKKVDNNGQYTIIVLKGNAADQIKVGTQILIRYYKNVGTLYNRHASTHETGGRDQIVVSEPMLDTDLTYKINNQVYTGTTAPTNAFKGQVWLAPL